MSQNLILNPLLSLLTILSAFFRLSGDLSIQMVTALVLQLIQCSVKIPEKTDEIQEVADTEDGGDENKPHVSFVNSILSVFMPKKSCS